MPLQPGAAAPHRPGCLCRECIANRGGLTWAEDINSSQRGQVEGAVPLRPEPAAVREGPPPASASEDLAEQLRKEFDAAAKAHLEAQETYRHALETWDQARQLARQRRERKGPRRG